ncbi:MAG: hypothetical protein DHS20C14_11810 [Phycisphaeraceae bacterium]|nr:MAG: hypothetical protein DHS20C14_11810 [Phycisphaeraceae bacterium]
MRPTTALISLASVTLLLSAGCERQSQPTAEPVVEATEPTGPAWVLTSEPADAQSVSEAKASATEGEELVIRGRIGGRKEPIAGASPVFTIVDLALPHCGENPADRCRTPWDYCCETPETITSNAATVQLVNADGTPFAGDPIAAGLNPLDEVVVVGRVGPRPTADVLTLLVSGVYRVEN